MPQNRIRPADAFCSASRPVRTMQTTAGQHEADGWRNCSGCHYWRPLSDRSGTGSWTGRRVCHYCLDHQTRRPPQRGRTLPCAHGAECRLPQTQCPDAAQQACRAVQKGL